MNLRQKLSVAIITRDEEENIGDCIRSVPFADEIVVVDSGSQDRTVEIAKALGCQIFHHPFSGFGPQKQFAVDRCKHDWVLLLDADERVPSDSGHMIVDTLTKRHQDAAGFIVQRKNFLHGRWIRHCGWWPDPLVRLVNRQKGCFSPSVVHERWDTEGKVPDLSCAIEHYSFHNYSEMLDKLQCYSTFGAQNIASENRTVSSWSAIGHGIWTFIQVYFLKLGILVGFDGFVIALLNAGGSFMKYAKAREILKSRR